MGTLSRWFKKNLGVYLGNATAMRDFRVQLRGTRAIVLWSVYLFCLIGIAMLSYMDIAGGGSVAVVEAQMRLQDFYRTIVIMLGVMITMLAPALTATAVVAERQRRSLDLVFSAPVAPKYYLVGKMISSYRYTWMMLVLSLPVTATCVVLGGATWREVLVTYLILSLNGLIYTAMALLISTVANKPAPAIVYSYLLVGFYSVITGGMATSFLFDMRTGMEIPFVTTLTPFLAWAVADGYTVINEVNVPNWVILIVYSLLMCKIFLLGAASVLSPFGAPETKSLRIHGLIYVTLLYFLMAWFATASVPFGSPGMAGTFTLTRFSMMFLGWSLLIMLILMPFLSTFGRDGERKFWHDGVFSLRAAFRGTPAGGLPYTWMLLAGAIGGTFAGSYLGASKVPSSDFIPFTVWLFAFWTFSWAVGRWASATLELRSARAMQFATMLALLGLPLPFLTLFAPGDPVTGQTSPLWSLYLLNPVIAEPFPIEEVYVMSLVLFGLSVILVFLSESRVRVSRAARLEAA